MLFGIWPRMPKFRHTYVITYGHFMIIVESCLRSSNKHVALQNLSIYYVWKNIRQQYENNNLKIIAPRWNDEFELPDGCFSVSDIQDYNE